MSSSQINQALKEIIPSYNGENRSKLINYVDSLYHLSLRKQSGLPNNSGIGRYHLCTYVIAEKYQNLFDLPTPDKSRIPIQPQLVDKLIDDFRDFVNQLSAASTPNSSPQKRKRIASTPNSSPQKRKRTASSSQTTPVSGSFMGSLNEKIKQSGSPLKKLRQAADTTSSNSNNDNDIENDIDNEDKNSPFIEKPKTPSKRKTRHDPKVVSIPEFITFCNTFFIPAKYSSQMIRTFFLHKHKFAKKTDWPLACGIIYAAYIRINSQLLSKTIGAKSEFMALMLQYQRGGLSKSTLQSWCTLVGDWIKDEPWIQAIEKQYVAGNEIREEDRMQNEYRGRVGEGWALLERFGAMIHGEHLYESNNQIKYYNTWSKRAHDAFEQLS
ncbi:hypothetical protein KGF56_003994 [Candida oxycetoniae]|uniref:ORC6 first cyclin-like domain-containing protein n=1 Tax=Candida oxycetoniae TaxID=497107 RepID=A0AAI9SUD7_9ASCO|nr:uncharacterized protein KGF56_003994 [Candida oxycetoniae]KAI3403197.2 hypothetical protein KGF56_003994 [Candida oxycetoniae]